MATNKFGRFPRSLVSITANQSPAKSNGFSSTLPTPSLLATPSMVPPSAAAFPNADISKPVPGSLIHTGHGDIDANRCWGHVDHIDDIYLKNPVLKPTSAAGNSPAGISFIPSISNLHDDPFRAQQPENGKAADPLKAWETGTVGTTWAVKSRMEAKAHGPERRKTTIVSDEVMNSLEKELKDAWDKAPKSSSPPDRAVDTASEWRPLHTGPLEYDDAIAIPQPVPGSRSASTTEAPITSSVPTASSLTPTPFQFSNPGEPDPFQVGFLPQDACL